MDDVMVDIEMDIMQSKERPNKLKVGNIYLAVSVYTYRVRIERTDFVHSKCLCFCIDSGITKWFEIEQIFVCQPEFLKFPAQAICLSLIGLGDCIDHPNAACSLEDVLADQSFIADVITHKSEYDEQLAVSSEPARIEVVLYDTSSTVDVQLNDVLLSLICSQPVLPTLEPVGLNEVTIVHISDTGEIFCRLISHNLDMDYIEKRIEYLIASPDFFERNRYSVDDETTPQHVYLVQDPVDKRWHRASVLQQQGERCQVIFVDDGQLKIVEKQNIYRLESSSYALSKYPFQVICCRLFEVAGESRNLVAQLRNFLSPGTAAMVSD